MVGPLKESGFENMNKIKKKTWEKPSIVEHGDASDLIKGGVGGLPGKELGPGDGIVVDDNPVSGPR